MAHRSIDSQPQAPRVASMARRLALCAGLAIAGALPGHAQTAPAQTAPAATTIPVPPAVATTLTTLSQGHAKILKAFKAPAGLVGIAISTGPGHNAILYATPDGAYLFQGAIISAKGENLTQLAAQSVLPKPPTAAENFAALGKTHSYLWGQPAAKKEMWIVFDPNCIFCHKIYEDLKAHVAAGEVKVHIIQVGFLKPSSLGKAAAILAAKDPATALATDESGFDAKAEEGGITPDMTDKAAVAEVKANNAWMSAQGIGGTPYLLYRDANGKVQGIAGYDPDTTGLLAKIGPKG
jgi:thiol:disulfide interchange protein DsbG